MRAAYGGGVTSCGFRKALNLRPGGKFEAIFALISAPEPGIERNFREIIGKIYAPEATAFAR